MFVSPFSKNLRTYQKFAARKAHWLSNGFVAKRLRTKRQARHMEQPSMSTCPQVVTRKSLVLVSVPEHVLPSARSLVMKHHGYCAAFTREDPLNPRNVLQSRMRASRLHEGCLTPSIGSLIMSAIGLLIMSAKRKVKHAIKNVLGWEGGMGNWQSAWIGRVSQSFQQLTQETPEATIMALAVRGGEQCQWEVRMLSAGSPLQQHLPHYDLKVFEDLNDLTQFLQTARC